MSQPGVFRATNFPSGTLSWKSSFHCGRSSHFRCFSTGNYVQHLCFIESKALPLARHSLWESTDLDLLQHKLISFSFPVFSVLYSRPCLMKSSCLKVALYKGGRDVALFFSFSTFHLHEKKGLSFP